MTKRLVVYLDVNVLSPLAEVTLGRTDVRLGEDALTFLTSLIESGLAIFPDSWTRQAEVELRRGVTDFEHAAHQLAGRLSRGVRFHPGRKILCNQLRNLFVAYLDGTGYTPTWQEAFAYDPRAAIPRTVEETATHVSVRSDDERRERRRELKDLSVDYHQKRAKQRADQSLTYEQLKALNAREYLNVMALDPLRRYLLGGSQDVNEALALNATAEAIEVAKRRGDRSLTKFWTFVKSDEVLKVPIVDIRASIETSMELDEPSRKWCGSDHYDLEAVSEVLPYCDAVFCDRNMREILRRRDGVASQYGTAVYSLRDFQRFRQDVDTCSGRHGAT